MGQSEIQSNQSLIKILHISQEELLPSLKILPLLGDKKNASLRLVSMEKIRDKIINKISEQLQLGASWSNIEYMVEYKSFDYLSEQLLYQNEGMQIEKMLTDELQCNKILYLTKKRQAQNSIILRLYKQEKSNQHLQILREIYYYQKVKLLNCQSLHLINKSYCIKSNKILNSQQVQVIVLEYINITLQELIKSRRNNKIEWQISQFMHLAINLTEAVSCLHASEFTHNDIRPSNIYYSHNKKRFILGSFSKMTNFNENHHQNLPQIQDNMKQDVYMLGISLLSAFYLVPYIDRKKCAPFNRMLINQYPILQIIKVMVCSPEKRANIFEIRQKLKQYEKLQTISEISSLNLPQSYTIRKNEQQTYRYKRLYSDFYKHIGLIDKWKQSMNDPIIHHRLSEDTIQSASSFEQFALISELQGNQQNYKNYYKHSTSIYLNIGRKHHNQRDYCSSIKIFEKGLSLIEKLCLKTEDTLYLNLQMALKQSQILSGQRNVQLDEIKRLQSKIISLKKQDYLTYWKFIEILVNIYTYLELFNDISRLLKECDEISDNIQSKIGPLKLKKMIASNNIQMANLMNDINPDKARLIRQTEQIIDNILNHKQYYFIIYPLQKMQIKYLHAKLNILADKRKEAIQQIQQALLQHAQYFSFTQQTSNNLQNSNQHQLLKGRMLQLKGDAYISLGQIQQGFNSYSCALKQYKNYFGDIYNIQSAIILQKIGQIENNKCNSSQYINKIELALKIIRTQYGLYHKYNIKLMSIHKQINDSLQENTKLVITPFTLCRSRVDTQSNISQFK